MLLYLSLVQFVFLNCRKYSVISAYLDNKRISKIFNHYKIENYQNIKVVLNNNKKHFTNNIDVQINHNSDLKDFLLIEKSKQSNFNTY